MFGKPSHVSPLESRKQRLIAESELNRAQMSEEWQTMTREVRDLARRAKTFSRWASSAALLAAGLAASRRGKALAAREKPSWLQRILRGAQLAGTIWLVFRGRSG